MTAQLVKCFGRLLFAASVVHISCAALTATDCVSPAFWNAVANSCYEYVTNIYMSWYDGQRTCRALGRKKYLNKARGRLGQFPTPASLTSDFASHFPSDEHIWIGLIRKPGAPDNTTIASDHMWAEMATDGTLIAGPDLSWTPTTLWIKDRQDDCLRMQRASDDWRDRGCSQPAHYILCEYVDDASHVGSCVNYESKAGLRASDGNITANSNVASVQECAELCNMDAQCLAVSYPTTGSDECRLSAHFPSNDTGMFDSDGGWDSYGLI